MAQSANMTGVTRTRALGTVSAYAQVRSSLQSHMNDDFANVFFNQTEFGSYVTYVHSRSGNSVSYETIFDTPSQNVNVSSNTEILSAKPQIILSTTHMQQYVSLDDVVIKDNICYTVDSYEDDGQGVITIYLTRENQRVN